MDKANKLILGSISGWALLIVGGAWSFLQFVTPELTKAARLDAENAYLKEQLIQLKDDKSSLQKALDVFAKSSSSNSIEAALSQDRLDQCSSHLRDIKDELAAVSSQNTKLAFLADSTQRCAPYRKDIEQLKNEMAGKTFETLGRPPGPERKVELNALISQHQKTLQTCLSSGR